MKNSRFDCHLISISYIMKLLQATALNSGFLLFADSLATSPVFETTDYSISLLKKKSCSTYTIAGDT